MLKIKHSKKRKRSQRLSLVSVVSIVMTGVLCLGMLSSFGRVSSGKINSEKSEIIKDTTNNFDKGDIKDTVLGSDYIKMLVDRELETPENANEVISIDFSEAASTYSEIGAIPGMRVASTLTGMKYGHLTAENRYLEFYTDEGTNNYNYNAWFAFNFREGQNDAWLDCSKIDYLVLDFDIWTKSEYFEEMFFYFQGELNGEKAVRDSTPRMTLQKNSYGTYFNGDVVTDEFLVEDTSYPLHITYIVKLNHDALSDTYTYINGKFFSSTMNTHYTFDYLDHFRVFMPIYHENSGVSVCFDNVQVMTFGNGDETYSGPISTCFNDTSIKLQNVPDSVLYQSKIYRSTKQEEQ